MRAGTILQLLNEAIDAGNEIALTADPKLRQRVITLLGYLRAVEAVVKQEAGTASPSQQRRQDEDAQEVKKVEKRLKLWSRKPDQINSQILTCYLKLRYEERVEPVPLDLLRERYVREHSATDSREFDGNFSLMRLIGRTNHGKIFDVDADNRVTVWPKAEAAVENFRKERQIGSNRNHSYRVVRRR